MGKNTLNENKELKNEELLKLLDLDFFQRIQDRLATEFNIASVITDIDGNPLTKTSNFSSFCMNYVRKSEQGFKNCKMCDALGGFSAKRIMKPVIYTCHTGLTDFASPIIVRDKLVGCFLCGQILTNKLSEEHFQKIAKKLSQSRDNYSEALKKIRIMPFEKVEYFANFLFEISTKISDFSHYQSMGNSSSKELESNLNELFNILIENKKEQSNKLNFFKKLKLSFFKAPPDIELISQNIEDLNRNFLYVKEKLKYFNKKFENFKL